MGDIIFLFKFLRVHIRKTIKTGSKIKILAEESISYWVLIKKLKYVYRPCQKKEKLVIYKQFFFFRSCFGCYWCATVFIGSRKILGTYVSFVYLF